VCVVPTTKELILQALHEAGKPLDDDELAALLKKPRQAINQAGHALESEGQLVRRASFGSKIQNVLTGSAPLPPQKAPRPAPGDGLLQEDEVKAAVRDHLEAQGYDVDVAWGHERGIDIEARRPGDRILIEAKGEVLSDQQQGNYFIGALGELVQRLADPNARYGLALPDNRRYRGLVQRLPALARQRLNLVVYMVRRTEQGVAVTEI
jgi:hypothetical protein